MTKTGYKRFKKEELSKVKLKGTKQKKLAKRSNETNVNFKVKKIIIKDQLKHHESTEILTRRKLNCRDLVSRLTHHNNIMKQEAIFGLKELMSTHAKELINSNLPLLINSVPKLLLDSSASIRKEGNKLLESILCQVSEQPQMLRPLFSTLVSYLICGLTNIDQVVREDALSLLDSILKYRSDLCVQYVPKLLPICLDLMSSNSSGSRTLSINLDSKLTSGIWRGNVLARIWTLLKALLNSKTEAASNKFNSKHVFITDVTSLNKEEIYFGIKYLQPIYNLDFSQQKVFLNSLSNSKENQSDFDLKDFCTALLPLILEAFIEMVPPRETIDTTGTVTQLSFEAALSLKFIAEIIHFIWNLFEMDPDSKENLKWIKKKFGKTFTNSLIQDRFPYAMAHTNETKKNLNSLNSLLSRVGGGFSHKCVQQNLVLSNLILLFSSSLYLDSAVSYLKESLRNSSELSEEESKILVTCLSRICSYYPKEACFCLETLNKLSNSSNEFLRLPAIRILYSIACDRNFAHLYSDPAFLTWLKTLPQKLISSSLSSEELSIIYDLARRQSFEAFSAELDSNIEMILDNVTKLRILNEKYEDEARRKVIHLLYWVRDWDRDLITSLEEGIGSKYWGDRFTKEISSILTKKKETWAERRNQE